MTTLQKLYRRLLADFGPQGWWPLLTYPGVNPTRSGTGRGYHPGDYSLPRHARERFEICCGAILTQNTAWTGAEKALQNLAQLDALAPDTLLALAPVALREAVRPAGCFNVKAEKLRRFASFYRTLNGRVPSRQELLGVWGVGPETADSQRLYAFGQLEMVVDAYTRRVLAWLALVRDRAGYDEVKAVCIGQLPATLEAYQEFHALMVALGKRHFSRRPYGCEELRSLIVRRPCAGAERG